MTRFHRYLVTLMMIAFVGTVLMFGVVGLASADTGNSTDLKFQQEGESVVPSEISEIVQSNPSEASEDDIETVQEWFYSNGDSLPDGVSNDIGSWLQQARQAESTSESDNTVEQPDEVVVEINDNLTVRDYTFDEEDETVTLVISADEFTEQIALTDPRSSEDTGVSDVNQKGVTVPRGETIEVEFDVEYSAYTGSSKVWISAGVGETKSVANDSQELINRLDWEMIPATAIATTLSAGICAIVVIYLKQRKLKNTYTNGPRNI